MVKTAAEIWRDYEIDGVPASGPNQPDKRDIRLWSGMLESTLGQLGLGYATRALLNADLAHAAHTLALVYADMTPANNGVYEKFGGSGTGSWVRVGDLPTGVVNLTVVGGTANAILASAVEDPLQPGRKLYVMTPAESNTGPTTISVNGDTIVSIKNAVNSNLVAGSLIAGSPVLMIRPDDDFRLVAGAAIDGGAILADAIAARDAAIAAAAAVTGRINLVADLNLFVRQADGNDGNDGSADTAGAAWKTLERAIAYVQQQIDLRGRNVTIQARGTFPESLFVNAPFVGDNGRSVNIVGPGSPSDFQIQAPGGAEGVVVQNGATLGLQNVRIKAPGSNGVRASFFGQLYLVNHEFDDAEVRGYATRFGYLDMEGDFRVLAGGSGTARMFEATHHGNIRWTSSNGRIHVTGTHTYLYVVNSESQGDITFTTFDNSVAAFDLAGGTVTGIRYRANGGGYLQWVIPLGGGETAFPGTVVGFVDASSCYNVGQFAQSGVVQSFTRDVSLTGNQSITGVGFRPRSLIVMGGVNGAAGRASWGMAGGGGSGVMRWNNGITADSFFTATSILISIIADGSNFSQASLVSFDDDGFTINWTKTGSPTGAATFIFMARP